MPGRDHRFSRRRLEAFVDGELPWTEVERLCLHLVDCEDCSAEARFLLALQAVFRALRVPG